MSYAVDGKQYVAVVVGRTVSTAAFMGDIGNKIIAATPEGGARLSSRSEPVGVELATGN